MALIVLDASVLIALFDPADALHSGMTAALRSHADDDLKIPASAYSESLVGPARHGRSKEAKQAIRALLAEVVVLSEHIAEEAAELRAHHSKLRLPDALVIATGNVLDADVILTGDSGWRRLAKSVQVVPQS
ncbi:MAG TPA: PIN domain-containing protein [Candidatus Dormibacteraeota bacterium]